MESFEKLQNKFYAFLNSTHKSTISGGFSFF